MATGQSYVMNLRRDKFNDIRVRQAVGLLFNLSGPMNRYFMVNTHALIHFGKT